MMREFEGLFMGKPDTDVADDMKVVTVKASIKEEAIEALKKKAGPKYTLCELAW